VTTDLNQSTDDSAFRAAEIRGLSVQPNGKILTTGTYSFNSDGRSQDVNLLPMSPLHL